MVLRTLNILKKSEAENGITHVGGWTLTINII